MSFMWERDHMKCQRKKIDNEPCRGFLFGDDKATAFWGGFRICSKCYDQLHKYNKEHKRYLIRTKAGGKYCSICHKLIVRETKTNLCRKCFDMQRRMRLPIILSSQKSYSLEPLKIKSMHLIDDEQIYNEGYTYD